VNDAHCIGLFIPAASCEKERKNNSMIPTSVLATRNYPVKNNTHYISNVVANNALQQKPYINYQYIKCYFEHFRKRFKTI
jgi:hypothetical protein